MAEKYRILAVDDEQDVLDVMQRALEDEYEVYTANSGMAALELLHKVDIDLLITDQRMPEMSGIKLIEQAKQINPNMVRIILTGYTEPRDLVDAINRGEVYRYITKPFDLNELLFTIKNGLETYQLRRDKERLLIDLERRLNAMTVFLDLSKEAALAQTDLEAVQSVVKYLPFILDFDMCVSLIEQETGGKALLNIHTQRPVHEKLLFEARSGVLKAYGDKSGRLIRDQNLIIQLTGEPTTTKASEVPFRSQVEVLLKTENEPTGLIQLFSTAEDAFRPDIQQILDILANQTSEIIRGLRTQFSLERQRMELMVQSLADGVIMVDDQDRVFVINPAARKLLHLSPDTPVNTRYLKDTLGFYPFDLVRGWSEQEGAIVTEEIQVFDQILHSIVSPVRMGQKLVGVAVVLRDITEAKRLEERKEEFVSIVSHELRTPLTSIGGALDLLLHRFAGEVNEKQERYLNLAKGSCDKLNMIIDELLDLSRFEKGKMRMEMGQLDLVDMVKEAAENYQAVAEERKVNLEIEVPQGEIIARADRNRLQQVLSNLLSNALKFTKEGGLIRVDLVQAGLVPGLACVSVYNDGDEIEEQDHERIFDKFEQAKSSRSAVTGSGLGLSICKSIVETHGGRIWVESGRGQGTRFIFTLPLPKVVDEEVSEVELPGLVDAVSKARFKTPPRILVVDDDQPTTYVVKGLLMAQGLSVLVTHNGREGLRLARERNPDLIIMDIRMPDIDGLQVTDILHHDPATREIPVLVLSALESEQEAYKAGATAYLSKPVSLGELAQAVQKLLEERNLVKRLFKVLIVDDDPAIRSICKEVLEEQGYATLEAECGKEALEQVAKNPVDVILLDVLLPDFDGFQVTEKIRENRNTQDVPIIFISARGQTVDKVRALKLGADDYMVKPFDALVLGARVDSVIKRKERELDSSPTTKLPGSVALERELNRRLAERKPFTLCYLDLDNLKAFNDYYGYAKADGVIQQTGDLIRKAVENLGTPMDFVGHIAGDDFVVVTERDRIEAIANEVIASFDRVIPLYYDREDQQRGYIVAEDRYGQERRFGIMSISLAAVHVEPGQYKNHSEISARAAELKNKAKSIEGSVLVYSDQDQSAPE